MTIFPALIFALIATICFGTASFLLSRSAKKMTPVQTGFLFQLCGMPALFLLLPFAPHTTHTAYIPIICIGIYQTFAMLIWYYALRVGNVSLVVSVSEVYSLISVLLGVVFFHETVGILRLFGILLMFVGVSLVGFNWTQIKAERTISMYQGIIPAMIYAVLLAIFFLFAAISARENGWFVSTFGIRIVIVAISFLLLIFQKKTKVFEVFQNVSWKWIISAGMIDAIGFGVFSLALTFSQFSYVAVIASSATLVTVLLSYIFLKEKLLIYQMTGIFAVVAGLIFLQLH